jgi:hypothetical protein
LTELKGFFEDLLGNRLIKILGEKNPFLCHDKSAGHQFGMKIAPEEIIPGF